MSTGEGHLFQGAHRKMWCERSTPVGLKRGAHSLSSTRRGLSRRLPALRRAAGRGLPRGEVLLGQTLGPHALQSSTSLASLVPRWPGGLPHFTEGNIEPREEE